MDDLEDQKAVGVITILKFSGHVPSETTSIDGPFNQLYTSLTMAPYYFLHTEYAID
jgi:hypothetical protein